MTLYDTLGVPPDSDLPTIKRAYRKRAKQLHPDKGGSTEEFQRLARAYMVLADPSRRAKYDRDGTFDADPVNDPLHAAMSLIVQFFMGVAQQAGENLKSPIFGLDLIAVARKEFAGQATALKRDKVKNENQIKVWEKLISKLKHRKADDLVRHGLRSQLAGIRQIIAAIDKQITMRVDALRLLEGYSFEFDVSQVVMPTATEISFFRIGI